MSEFTLTFYTQLTIAYIQKEQSFQHHEDNVEILKSASVSPTSEGRRRLM